MKKLYDELEMEVIRFNVEDVITASGCVQPLNGVYDETEITDEQTLAK